MFNWKCAELVLILLCDCWSAARRLFHYKIRNNSTNIGQDRWPNIWWPVSAKPLSKMKRDLRNTNSISKTETAFPNSKRDLQIHNYGFSEVCVYEFGDWVSDSEMPFRFWRSRSCFGDRVSFWRSRFISEIRFGTYGPPYKQQKATCI